MNPNAAKNHVSISAPKQPIRCWKTRARSFPNARSETQKYLYRIFDAAEPRSRENVRIVNIPAPLCHQPSCNKSLPTHDIKISSTAEKFQTPRILKISNTADIKNFKHRQNVVHFNIPAPLCIQTSCNKPGPLAKFREMNSNAAKNHVSISAPKQPVRCCKMSGPLRPLGPLRKPKMFAQNLQMPPSRGAAKPRTWNFYKMPTICRLHHAVTFCKYGTRTNGGVLCCEAP